MNTSRLACLSTLSLAACSRTPPAITIWAIGTTVRESSIALGIADPCTVQAPNGEVVDNLVVKPGIFHRTCPGSGQRPQRAAFADRLELTLPLRIRVGEPIDFEFKLAVGNTIVNAREMGVLTLADNCQGVIDQPGYEGAQDSGRSPFQRSRAIGPGTCDITLTLDWSEHDWQARGVPPPPRLAATQRLQVE